MIFDKHDINLIKETIQKELKDIDYDQYLIKIGDQIVEPISDKSGIETIVLTPNVSHPFGVAKYIITDSNIQTLNSSLIQDLENGISALDLTFTTNSIASITNLDHLFANIRLDYIHTVVTFDDQTLRQLFGLYIDSLSYEIPSDQLYYTHILLPVDHIISDGKSIIDSISNHNLWIEISLNDNFFLSLCSIRAFKTLLDSYIRLQNINVNYRLIASTNVSSPTSDVVEQLLLNHTTQAISGLLASVDGISVGLIGSLNPNFDRRMSRNIFNILNEESYLTLVADPSAGSYYIDQYTHAIAKAIYDK